MQQGNITLNVPYGEMAAIRWVNHYCDQKLPILALHGWLDNANSFVPLAPGLAQVASEIVAVDLAGHGHSDHRGPGNYYHFVDYVFDVIACANTLGWDQFILIGHSMGAGIASLIAAVAPERISKLILLDGIGPMSSKTDAVTEQLAKSIRLHQRIEPRLKQLNYPDWNTLIKRRAAVGNISLNTAELLVKRNAKQHEERIIWQADRRLNLISPIYMAESQVLSFLSQIESETLLINAEQGLLCQRSNTTQRISAVNKLKFVELAGGHHMHMESPEQVAKQLIQFITSTS